MPAPTSWQYCPLSGYGSCSFTPLQPPCAARRLLPALQGSAPSPVAPWRCRPPLLHTALACRPTPSSCQSPGGLQDSTQQQQCILVAKQGWKARMYCRSHTAPALAVGGSGTQHKVLPWRPPNHALLLMMKWSTPPPHLKHAIISKPAYPQPPAQLRNCASTHLLRCLLRPPRCWLRCRPCCSSWWWQVWPALCP